MKDPIVCYDIGAVPDVVLRLSKWYKIQFPVNISKINMAAINSNIQIEAYK